MAPSPAHGRGRSAPGSGVVHGAASEDSRARRRGDEPTRIRPPGEPSQAPVGAPPEYTREPSTTGIGPWREHDFTGRVFSGRFKLRRRLGKGGMATVYETFDQVLHKSVAVKVLNPEHSESAELNRRFLEEARAISQLEHDHIVDVIDIGETEDGLVYLVMELLKGEDLGETLWQDGRLAWWRVLDMGTQICEALAAAHERGIIHRDIKPANCMRIAYRGKSDFIKVLDFGIAKFTPSYYHQKRQLGAPEESNAELPTDQFLGTPGYMAPEQLDNAPFDPRVDIYGLGALMYRLLTNKMPVPTGARAGAGAHDHTPVPPSVAVSGVEIPEPLERAVLQALAPDPDARFQSALQFRDALTQIERELRPPSRLTGDPKYLNAARQGVEALHRARSPIGLVGTVIDVETGEWTNRESHISGMIDSYYEYLLKAGLLFDDQAFLDMWEDGRAAVHHHLSMEAEDGSLWYGRVDMETGETTATTFGALDAFLPAVLALGGDLDTAGRLMESVHRMWTEFDVEPEGLDFTTMQITSPGYPLRPEAIESAYYLFVLTGEERWRDMGRDIFQRIVRWTRTDAGFAHLADVRTKEQADAMESFFLAETLKYAYLLADPGALDFDAVVFNTEAHKTPLLQKALGF